jgi:uncharacterized phage-associated protein
MPTMKLHKLVCYAQAWSLVWDERPLFEDPIEAWANGPVAPALYAVHRGWFDVDQVPGGDADRLDALGRETIDAVLATYGGDTAYTLSVMTHREQPWKVARGDLPDGVPGHTVISPASLAEYYGSLVAPD